ncbi:MAG: DNA mismatch repair endonuclease MutL [Deltaproteobacteria bacterium]|nr:DNA mismatch repair endonuclease MutL [Deltaproteobacteria bacterium]
MNERQSPPARIRQLPEKLVLKMAAGEVVERPASVVKELCENSVDAGARRVDVRVEKAGVEIISVVDDGCGIEPSDLRLAVGRHATSKIGSEGDLHSVGTLGFRGEALASVAAVSRLEIVTRVGGRPMGARIVVEGSEVTDEGDAGAPVGTQITVRDLFFNTPVRRKFLRSPQTELSHVIDAVARVALGFPGVHFTLNSNGKVTLDCPPTDDPAERAVQVLGDEARGRLFTIRGGESGMAVLAICSDPGASRGSMSSIYVLVNGRHVLDKGLRRVTTDAFRNVLPAGRYPLAVIGLEVPRIDVDVNVHPQKSEVRFAAPGRVYGFVSKALADAIARAPWLEAKGGRVCPSPLAPRPSWAPKDYAVERGDAMPTAAPTPSYWPSFAKATEGRPSFAGLPFSPDDVPKGFFSSRVFRGQVFEMYLVFEGPDDVVFVDQHAAHERIAFQKIIEAHEGKRRVSQMLLVPHKAELSPRHAALVGRHLDSLNRMGIVVEPFGPNAFLVRGLPQVLSGADPKAVLADVVDEIESVGKESAVSDIVARVASRVACHAVVRGRHKLSAPEAESLARQLDACNFGTACPHGRPVYFLLPRGEVEKRFWRK